MFTIIEKTNSNKQAITILENAVKEQILNRFILFGNDKYELTQLVEHFLTALNFQEFNTKYIHIKDITNKATDITDLFLFNKAYDMVAIDGLEKLVHLSDRQIEIINDLLNALQHDQIILTTTLTAKETFSTEIRDFFDNTGITWSRNFLGCKQLFMDDFERKEFIHLLNEEHSSDYRVIQSLEHLNSKVSPYDELDFLTPQKIKDLLQSGDDSHHNCLVITKEPALKLIQPNEFKKEEVAVNLETFAARNKYVGQKVGDIEIKSYYRMLLEGYYFYLKCDQTFFVDSSNMIKLNNQQLIKKIKQIDDEKRNNETTYRY